LREPAAKEQVLFSSTAAARALVVPGCNQSPRWQDTIAYVRRGRGWASPAPASALGPARASWAWRGRSGRGAGRQHQGRIGDCSIGYGKNFKHPRGRPTSASLWPQGGIAAPGCPQRAGPGQSGGRAVSR
jgi:hypothetical protein